MNTLGLVYWKKGDYPNATEVFQRTLQICEKSFGPDSLNAAHALGNLGIMAKETGDYPRAVGYYARDLAVVEKLFGKQHRQVVQPLEDFGILYRDAGDYVRAEPMFLRALAITEQSVGPEHADIARHLLNLASLYAASGDRAKALESLTRMSAVEERNLPLNLAVGSERQKLAYFGPLAGRLEELISFQVREQGSERQARDLAATMLLQRKGRVLDAMADSLGALRTRANPEDAGLVDDLRRVTAELAAVALNAPRVSLNEQQRHVNTLITQREQLEQELNRRTAGYYEASGIVTLAAVRATIPADAALIEFAVYRPFYPERAIEDRNRRGDPRYVAYVIRHEGDVQWTELGSAKDLDEAVAKFRRALADPKRGDVRELARLLDEQTMRPLRSVIGDAARLLVAPDGQLDLIPFEALVDEEGRYLVERYAINYLTTGRDLLRMTAARSSKSPPLVVAYPSFGETKSEESSGVSLRQAKGAPPRRARRSITTAPTLANVYFAPLTGTRQEALAIQSLFPETTILSASQATKSALKQVEGPRMLHIATHGFFLQDGAINNPLLRSGLALAGANTDTGSADRGGILTALEASTLNLWGTKLVTLSACDTGVGEVRNGEGVFGLRRAFFLAGAETLVMSLWPVSDYVTREMMTTYYSGLKTGLGRGEALRQAQLAMMKRKGREHPFFWASFIQAGEWANLDGRR